MRPPICSFILLFLVNTCIAQKELSQAAINDFAQAAQITYLVNDNFYLTVNYYFQSIGKKEEDAHEAFLNFSTDPASRELIFKSLHQNLRNNRLALVTYLGNTMNIKTGIASELADYIYAYYAPSKAVSSLFKGTRTYLDSDSVWQYVVTITGNRISLKCYPGKNNDYHKDKTKATRTYTGIVKEDRIIIDKNRDEFKISGSFLYQRNNEGDWNEYLEDVKIVVVNEGITDK